MRWTSALVLVVAALVAGAARADDERVLPAALDGDPGLVAQVGDELARRGVGVGTGDQVVAVTLTQAADGIQVALRDPQGRTALRLVSSVETAAALVESWARRDIADPLLEPRTPPPPPSVAPPAVPPPPIVSVPVPIPPPPSLWTPVLRLGAESWNRSLWLAASGGACVRVGALCLGGNMRLAQQVEPRDDFHDRLWRPPLQTDLEGLFEAELPISLGRPVLLLGVGAGVGWRFDGQGAQAGLRGEARVGLALPLWSQLALEAGVTAALAPSPDDFDPMFPEPRPTERQLRLGFGLRWGLP